MVNKTYADTLIYKQGGYEENLFKFIMNAERIDKASPDFADIQYQVKRRQVTITLNRILMDPKIVLCKSPSSLPKSFKVFAAKDVKTDKVLKVFIDVSDIMRNVDGAWKCSNIDLLIAYLVSALTQILYFSQSKSILMNSTLTSTGSEAFAKLFTNIVDYLYKISLSHDKMDGCTFLAVLYYNTNILGNEYNSTTVIDLAKKISKISDRQAEVLMVKLNSDSFKNIAGFVKAVSEALKIDGLKLDTFIEKYIYLYGPGTVFSLEYFPAFASVLTDTYVGCYNNNQKTIEKVAGTTFVEFTKTLFRVGEGVLK